MRPYPTRHGISVPLSEIELPPATTNRENIHHDEWTARAMGRYAMSQCLRDLTVHQWRLALNQHKWIHGNFGPPIFPKPKQIMDHLSDIRDAGGTLTKRIHGRYTEMPFTDEIWQQLLREYDEIR